MAKNNFFAYDDGRGALFGAPPFCFLFWDEEEFLLGGRAMVKINTVICVLSKDFLCQGVDGVHVDWFEDDFFRPQIQEELHRYTFSNDFSNIRRNFYNEFSMVRRNFSNEFCP